MINKEIIVEVEDKEGNLAFNDNLRDIVEGVIEYEKKFENAMDNLSLEFFKLLVKNLYVPNVSTLDTTKKIMSAVLERISSVIGELDDKKLQLILDSHSSPVIVIDKKSVDALFNSGKEDYIGPDIKSRIEKLENNIKEAVNSELVKNPFYKTTDEYNSEKELEQTITSLLEDTSNSELFARQNEAHNKEMGVKNPIYNKMVQPDIQSVFRESLEEPEQK